MNAAIYKRLLVAHLIASGINTVPKLLSTSGLTKRTLQDTFNRLSDLGIVYDVSGSSTRDRRYHIKSWGIINHAMIEKYLATHE